MIVSQLHRYCAAEWKEHCEGRIGMDMEGNNSDFNLPRGAEKNHSQNYPSEWEQSREVHNNFL
jgi:hypothetical protein